MHQTHKNLSISPVEEHDRARIVQLIHLTTRIRTHDINLLLACTYRAQQNAPYWSREHRWYQRGKWQQSSGPSQQRHTASRPWSYTDCPSRAQIGWRRRDLPQIWSLHRHASLTEDEVGNKTLDRYSRVGKREAGMKIETTNDADEGHKTPQDAIGRYLCVFGSLPKRVSSFMGVSHKSATSIRYSYRSIAFKLTSHEPSILKVFTWKKCRHRRLTRLDPSYSWISTLVKRPQEDSRWSCSVTSCQSMYVVFSNVRT